MTLRHDELLEVPPKAHRLRKRILNADQRAKERKRSGLPAGGQFSWRHTTPRSVRRRRPLTAAVVVWEAFAPTPESSLNLGGW